MTAPPPTAGRLALVDRDGTINVDRNYVHRVEDVELLPDAAAGIRRLNGLGLPVAVITNQSGLARGLLTLDDVEAINVRIAGLLAAEGARLDAFYVCPHHPDDRCACRKPAQELLQRAAADFAADLARSFFIGDKAADVLAGRAAGAATVLVRTGREAEWPAALSERPDFVADNLFEAALWVERRLASGG
jgi:D-glycero-D-manno-heptose 1,7-bisphosphate phosphatase